jgi:hypothetical protein
MWDCLSNTWFYGVQSLPYHHHYHQWLYSPCLTLAASHRRFRNIIIKTHGRTPLDEWSTLRKGLYLHRTTQHRNTKTNIHASSGIGTHDLSNQAALDRAAAGTGISSIYTLLFTISWNCIVLIVSYLFSPHFLVYIVELHLGKTVQCVLYTYSFLFKYVVNRSQWPRGLRRSPLIFWTTTGSCEPLRARCSSSRGIGAVKMFDGFFT